MTWCRLAFRTLALLTIAAFFAAFVAIFYPDTWSRHAPSSVNASARRRLGCSTPSPGAAPSPWKPCAWVPKPLGGREGYRMLAEADETRTAPGGARLTELL